MTRYILTLPFLIFCSNTFCQRTLVAGFESVSLVDSSRIYKTGSPAADPFHYRPVYADLWYPSYMSAKKPLTYGRFLTLFQERVFYYTGNEYKGLDTSMATYLSKLFGSGDTLQLLHEPLRTFHGAVRSKGKLPLIIYYCSYNGASHENIRMFESLALSGFVVASITSVGRFPGDMTMQSADLLEQVYDGLFILNRLANRFYIDTNKIAVMGYSWGGLAALVTATMQGSRIKALVSLDGSERHPYGSVAADDSLWNIIRFSPYFKPELLRSPYLYLSSDRKNARPDSLYEPGKLIAKYQKMTLDSATHLDFAVYSTYLKKNSRQASIYQEVQTLTMKFLEEFVIGKKYAFAAYQKKRLSKVKVK